ncbi:MAG: alpha-1,2-fucosyltransferase [Mucilaginibacter sp.]
MIISQIKHGLGNQLFQYAAGLSLARHLNAKLLLDLDVTSYETDFRRELCLKYFEIDDITTELKPKYEDIVFNLYIEPHFHFDNNFYNSSNFTYLSGYWQTDKYFIGIKEEIMRKFCVRHEYIAHLDIDRLKFDDFNSINLHIRRGDYAHDTFLGILSMDYYYRAITYFINHFENVRFYIFSDDIQWVKKNLNLKADHIFISGDYTKNSIEDFYLMQQCKHHIIANSTFSWWAAWLCKYQQKRIIAPTKWFMEREDADIKDLIPKTWLTI